MVDSWSICTFDNFFKLNPSEGVEQISRMLYFKDKNTCKMCFKCKDEGERLNLGELVIAVGLKKWFDSSERLCLVW